MRPVMLVILGVVALATSTNAIGPARASDRHPWCIVVQDRDDGWACGFDTFAQCLAEARAGNTGFCIANPAYQPPAPAKAPRQRRQAR